MTRLVCIACVIVTIVVVESKKWIEVRSCLTDKARECADKCKSEVRAVLFPVQKLTDCMKKSFADAADTMKSCLKNEGINSEDMSNRDCWKTNEDDYWHYHSNSDAPVKLPAAKRLMDCAKACMRAAKATCFDGCDAADDVKVDTAVKTCAAKTRDVIKPAVKECMKT